MYPALSAIYPTPFALSVGRYCFSSTLVTRISTHNITTIIKSRWWCWWLCTQMLGSSRTLSRRWRKATVSFFFFFVVVFTAIVFFFAVAFAVAAFFSDVAFAVDAASHLLPSLFLLFLALPIPIPIPIPPVSCVRPLWVYFTNCWWVLSYFSYFSSYMSCS